MTATIAGNNPVRNISGPSIVNEAQSFTIGSIGARLSSVTIKTTGGSGTAGFVLGLYSDSSGLPGSLLETLSGSVAPTSGDYTYTSAATTTLSANVTYWIRASVSTLGNFYRMVNTSSTAETSSNGWTIGNGGRQQSNGGSWNSLGNTFMMSVSATPVPEPAEYMQAMGMVALGAAVSRRYFAKEKAAS